MMATVLRDAGYRTASFVTNGWVARDVGMARGVDPAASLLWIASHTTMGAALKWLRTHPTAQFVRFVHIDEPPTQPFGECRLFQLSSREPQHRIDHIGLGRKGKVGKGEQGYGPTPEKLTVHCETSISLHLAITQHAL